MAQRMGNILEWNVLSADEAAGAFYPGRERMVALDVNAESECALYGIFGDEERFIALVKGRDRVEFSVPGDYTLFCQGGDVWYKTVDGSIAVNVEIAPVVFTRIANRKVRNHNLEMIEYKMNANLKARMEQMERDAIARIDDRERLYAASRRPLSTSPASGVESAPTGFSGIGEEPSAILAGSGGKDADKGGAGGKPAKGGKPAPATADD